MIIVASVCIGGYGIGHVVDRAEVLGAAVEVGHRGAGRSRSTSGRAAGRRRRRGRRSERRPPPPAPTRETARRGSASGRADTPTGSSTRCSPARAPRPRSTPSARNRRAGRSRPRAGGGRRRRSRRSRGCGRGRGRRRSRGRRRARLQQVRGREGVEDELAREAEQVERARPVLLDERPERPPVLAEHELTLGLRPTRRDRCGARESRRCQCSSPGFTVLT